MHAKDPPDDFFPSRPVGWPGNIPYIRGLEHALFSGFKEFYALLPHAGRTLFRTYVLQIADEHTLSDAEFAVMVELSRLFEFYCTLNEDMRDAFNHWVVCVSHPGAPVPEYPPGKNCGDLEGGGVAVPGDGKPIGGLPTTAPPPHVPTWSMPHWDPLPPDTGREPVPPNEGKKPKTYDRSVGGGVLPHDDPGVPGYCYLHLVVKVARARVGSSLGRNPWGPTVASTLLEEPGIWAGGRYTLTFGGTHVTDEGPNYTQGHIAEAHQGCKVQEILARMSGTMRVGMATPDLNAMVNPQAAVSAPSQQPAFEITPRGNSMELTIGVFAMIGSDQTKYPGFQWNVMSTPVLLAMLALYESVRLEEAEFEVKVNKGADNSVWCAITSYGQSISTFPGWLSAPVNTAIHGSDQGAVRGTFKLPEKHTFSKEIRANHLGNSPPAFHFGFTGDPGAYATIQGRIRVVVTGQSVLGFVNIGGPGGFDFQMKAARKDLRRLREELDIEEMDAPAFGTEESDSDSEEEAPKASPQRMTASQTQARTATRTSPS